MKRINETRRQLTYVTLFVAASILIVALTVVVYNLIGDELTPILFRKVITTAVIAIVIFALYLRDLRIGENVLGKNLSGTGYATEKG
jgi:chromate transport protein ChrA